MILQRWQATMMTKVCQSIIYLIHLNTAKVNGAFHSGGSCMSGLQVSRQPYGKCLRTSFTLRSFATNSEYLFLLKHP
jgi:hypothetical protein